MPRRPDITLARALGTIAVAVPALVAGVALASSGARYTPDAPFAPVSNAVAQTVTQAVATVAEASAADEGRQHLGFDTSIYPGDATMRTWKEHAPYAWVGFYLPAPCHKDASWSGKRQTLADMGWGIALVYVGQQVWERPVKPRSKSATTCATSLVSAQRGVSEAIDAVAKTASEGFPTGTAIFLDIERMERMPQKMRDYYRAWVSRVLLDGRYRPGIYAHKHNAEQIYADVRAAYDAAGVADEPPFWVASGRGFNEGKAPSEVGHQFANVWQGRLDITQRWNDVQLPIDVNVSDTPSPSMYGVVAAD
jgi:hypothetical protein